MADVRILMGRAHRLLAPVIAEIGALHAQGKSCILIVPEQFTLQAERELLDRLRLKGFFTIDVLSPSRFSHRVLTAVGADPKAPLSNAGRLMAVSAAMEKCEDQLHYYHASVRRRGFANKLASLIADMKRGGLDAQALDDYAQTLEAGARREKLSDLAILYRQYQQVLGDRFGDSEDQMRYIASRLPESGVAEGKHIFVYGFDALPEQLMQLLCAVARLCESLTVALMCDKASAPDGELYRPVRAGVARFRAMLLERGVALREEYLPSTELPHAAPVRHLDHCLYALPERRFAGEQNAVFFSVRALSPFEEATIATRQILRLCAEGVDIDRIALLYPDQNGYGFAVSAALRDSGLPFYTDEKLPATSHGLVRFLLTALRVMDNRYQSADMFSLMKTGYAPISFEEACELENYVREFGGKRARWEEPFTRGKGRDKEKLRARIERCETLRRRVMEPLVRARAAIIAARSVSQSLEAVMKLLDDVHAYEALQAEEEALVGENLLVRAGQNSQIWKSILELMDQMAALSDGKRVALKHIANRFESGFSAISLSALPPADHMLHAGVLGHSLSGDMDVVFLLGLNDGVLTKQTDSLLTEEERADAQSATEAFLGMTDESRALFAKMDVKRAMTLPKKQLFLSCAKTDASGKALRPLSLIATLEKRLFEGLPETPVPYAELPMSATQAIGELSGRLRAYGDGGTLPDVWQERLAKLLGSPRTASAATRLLRAADFRLQAVPLQPQDARRLFDDRTLDVSRLESFAACPFQHFLEHGLRPKVLQEWEITPLDRGNFYHDSLKNFAERIVKEPNYTELDERRVSELADEAIEPLLDELKKGPMGENARSEAAYLRAREVVHRACSTVISHLHAGEFRIYRSEAAFGMSGSEFPPVLLTLKDGTEVTLRGRIDRIDRLRDGANDYIRIIDYKSSPHSIEPDQAWYGLQLQLLLYLEAAVRGLPGSKPAGAFYFHVSDPVVESDSDSPTDARPLIMDKLKLKGVALADRDVLEAMDGDLESPTVLPKMVTKGGFGKNATVLDAEQMARLIEHSRKVASELAEDLFSGDTEIKPTRSGDRSPCAYCDYSAVCGFREDTNGAQARELPAMKFGDFKQALDGALDPDALEGEREERSEESADGE